MGEGDTTTGPPTETGSAARSGSERGSDDDAYRGLPGAIPYAFRASDSRLFRGYAVVGSLVAALVTLIFVAGLVTLIAATSSIPGGSLALSRAFFIVVALLVVFPTLAPVLAVARRRRLGRGDRRYEAALGAAGFVFLASLYVGLVISIPPDQQEPVAGMLAPVVGHLYALPQVAGLVPPALAAVGIWVAHRLAG